MLSSYHTHTTWSDGTADPAAMLAEARRVGLVELGFSDHLLLHPDLADQPWTMAADAVGMYVDEILHLARQDSAPAVRLGLEADYVESAAPALRNLLESFPFDYVIGSLHFVGSFCVDGEAAHWNALTADRRNEVWRAYWAGIRRLASSGLFDIVGHLDLPKKFGHRPTIDLARETGEALDAIAEAGIALELNTSGWSYPAAEQYPSAGLLREALRRNIPVIISADAHEPANLTRDFDRAVDLLRGLGFRQTVLFKKRGMTPIPL